MSGYAAAANLLADIAYLDDRALGSATMADDEAQDDGMAPYRNLARAVVSQALKDLVDAAKQADPAYALAQLKRLHKDEEWLFWCEVAGFDADVLCARLAQRLHQDLEEE
jgi:hypothetical protein